MRISQRLIVAMDFSPEEFGGTQCVREKVIESSRGLKSSDVYIKINSILR